MDVRVIVAAGGSGTRFGQAVPKQFAKLGTESILEHTVRRFEKCSFVKEIIIVLPPDFVSINDLSCSKVKHFVTGKNTRAESVYEGFLKISRGVWSSETIALVHDGVRPFVCEETIENVAAKALEHGTAIAAARVTDTIKKMDSKGFVCETVNRELLWKAATPQGFRMDILLEAYKRAIEQGYLPSATDEAFLVEKAGFPVYIIEGNPENIKITTSADLAFAESLLKGQGRQLTPSVKREARQRGG